MAGEPGIGQPGTAPITPENDPSDDDGGDGDELEGDLPSGEYCGRWNDGRLGQHCSRAGTEECDWECPYSR